MMSVITLNVYDRRMREVKTDTGSAEDPTLWFRAVSAWRENLPKWAVFYLNKYHFFF